MAALLSSASRCGNEFGPGVAPLSRCGSIVSAQAACFDAAVEPRLRNGEPAGGGMQMRSAARMLACVALVLASAFAAAAPAASVRAGIAAFNRENFNAAALILGPRAEAGDPLAQSYLGFMYETGRGVPQDYATAVYWYRRAANQGETTAQSRLGLLYDKGQGVSQNYIEAHAWLNLAAAHAPPATRDVYARLRDAVASKMTRGEIATSRVWALQWVAVRERPVLVAVRP
jgi:hypothetical protein